MADIKPGFTDGRLLALHRQVVKKIGAKRLKDFDRAYPTIDYEKTAPGPKTKGPDGVLQSYELFQAIISIPKLDGVYRKFAGESLPWRASDTSLNRSLFARFDAMVRAWKDSNPGIKPNQELAKKIYEWVIQPRAKGGLGMAKYRSHPEFTFDQAVQSTLADCTEIYYVLEIFLKRAGFQVRPHYVRIDLNGEPVLHVVAGVKIGKKTQLVDPLYRQFDAKHKKHTPLTHRQLLAAYWSNRWAVAVKQKKISNAEEFITWAQWINPHSALVQLSRGAHYTGFIPPKKKEALKALDEVKKLAPRWNLFHLHKGILHDRLGEFPQAVQSLKISLKLEPRERETRVHLVQALGCLGHFAEAKKELKALKDSYGGWWTRQQQQVYQRSENWLDHQMKTKKRCEVKK